jgi:predicted RNase H-like HicB family nuclease
MPEMWRSREGRDMRIEVEMETDGRWIAEISDLSGVLAYGATQDEAIRKAKALALRVLADRLEHGEQIPELTNVFAVPA